MDNEMFEDFSFKPITDGLGFHKKKLQIDEKALRDIQWKRDLELPEISFEEKEEPKSRIEKPREQSHSPVANNYPPSRLNLVDDEINFDKVRSEFQQKAKISRTLPRKDIEYSRQEQASQTSSFKSSLSPMREDSVEGSMEGLRRIEKRLEVSTEIKSNLHQKTSKEPAKVSGNWFSAMIDFVAIFGVINLFLSCLLFVTKLDVFEIISNSIHEPETLASLVALSLGSCFLYVVGSRSFLFSTLGDWALDIQLGTKKQQASSFYSLQVALRFFLNLAFGFILLPVLSVLFGKDLAGKLSGLQLYKLED